MEFGIQPVLHGRDGYTNTIICALVVIVCSVFAAADFKETFGKKRIQAKVIKIKGNKRNIEPFITFFVSAIDI